MKTRINVSTILGKSFLIIATEYTDLKPILDIIPVDSIRWIQITDAEGLLTIDCESGHTIELALSNTIVNCQELNSLIAYYHTLKMLQA